MHAVASLGSLLHMSVCACLQPTKVAFSTGATPVLW